MAFEFEVVGRDSGSRARAGIFHTPHGQIQTPVFMPVGTRATVKALSPDELREAGCQILLSNAYHLYLEPGPEVVAELGGLHGFMGWDRPILTDSGGFQILSLDRPGQRRKRRNGGSSDGQSDGQGSASDGGGGARASLVEVDEAGVTFRSHLDGTTHRITPESAVETQVALGADVVMAFDQCSPKDDDYDQAKAAMERTHRWAERCVARWRDLERQKDGRPPQALFAIVQGGGFEELRRASAEFVVGLGLPGVAIGGEAIGYSKTLTRQILEWVGEVLPEDRPRYAMGVGEPDDFFAVVERGVDMFDSVLPTRLARNGTLLTRHGRLRILSAEFASDRAPIDPRCDCRTCRRFSRAYLRHLFKCEEPLAYRLATIHNVRFCLGLVARMRESILGGSFEQFRRESLAEYGVRVPSWRRI